MPNKLKVVKLNYVDDTKAGFFKYPCEEKVPKVVQKVSNEVCIPVNPLDIPKCCECNSLKINGKLFNAFDVKVCRECENLKPEVYSLLTKTEAKQDYLLTEPEIKSLNYMEKHNPYKKHWFPMQLFLRRDLENFAINKWGSLDLLDQEYSRRVESKEKRKRDKYTKDMKKLQRTTRTEEWESKTEEHSHSFVDSKCSCGMIIHQEEI